MAIRNRYDVLASKWGSVDQISSLRKGATGLLSYDVVYGVQEKQGNYYNLCSVLFSKEQLE